MQPSGLRFTEWWDWTFTRTGQGKDGSALETAQFSEVCAPWPDGSSGRVHAGGTGPDEPCREGELGTQPIFAAWDCRFSAQPAIGAIKSARQHESVPLHWGPMHFSAASGSGRGNRWPGRAAAVGFSGKMPWAERRAAPRPWILAPAPRAGCWGEAASPRRIPAPPACSLPAASPPASQGRFSPEATPGRAGGAVLRAGCPLRHLPGAAGGAAAGLRRPRPARLWARRRRRRELPAPRGTVSETAAGTGEQRTGGGGRTAAAGVRGERATGRCMTAGDARGPGCSGGGGSRHGGRGAAGGVADGDRGARGARGGTISRCKDKGSRRRAGQGGLTKGGGPGARLAPAEPARGERLGAAAPSRFRCCLLLRGFFGASGCREGRGVGSDPSVPRFPLPTRESSLFGGVLQVWFKPHLFALIARTPLGLRCVKGPFTVLSLEEIAGHLNSRRFLVCVRLVPAACFSK